MEKSFKLLTMQDLSCMGQCSLTVALPILSHYGIETCVLPTAVLSNHTMFLSWSYLDLTPEIHNIFKEWEKNEIHFNAFLLGYLGKKELIDVAKECFKKFSTKDRKIFIDPVFADNGKIYPGFDEDYIIHLRSLLQYADFILPNVTEASYLAGVPYQEHHDEKYLKKIINELKKYTKANMIITGVEKENTIGEYLVLDDKEIAVDHIKVPSRRHGTGDIFSSVFTAKYLLTGDILLANDCASKFVIDCLKETSEEHFYGVEFEKLLLKEGK